MVTKQSSWRLPDKVVENGKDEQSQRVSVSDTFTKNLEQLAEEAERDFLPAARAVAAAVIPFDSPRAGAAGGGGALAKS
jgi:hypothetical protein